MSTLPPNQDPARPAGGYHTLAIEPQSYIEPEIVETPRPVWLPLALFALTCLTTYDAGGPWYALALMFTLLCHEFGHFLQAARYGVPASWPYFIPMPGSPLGTMGAVIAMRGHMGNRKALFDIGITGPLAGLMPALACTVVGLQLSSVGPISSVGRHYGEPLIFQFISYLTFGPIPENFEIHGHPLAIAGWVGIFITALNLIPIGQLDGGHVLYALLRRKAWPIAQFMLLAAVVSVVIFGLWEWSLMLLLLAFMGPIHPPTADDSMPLGRGRTILGWLTLAFFFVGFTPQPF